MPKCPNCGQTTARTEDWACQWCGYPLLSGSYKKIPKTYRQLQEEKLYKQELPVTEEAEPILEPEPALEAEPEPVLEAEPVAEAEAEPVVEAEPEPVVEAEPEPVTEAEPAPKAKAKPAPKAKAKPAPKAKAKPAPKAKAKSAPESKPEPTSAALEVTVEELLSAYEEDGVAADAKFANKILKVTGVVARIEVKDILDIHYITLTSAERTSLQDVRCMFDKEHGPELSQLMTGQTVTVQGKYDGSIINIRMIDCVLVR